MSDKQVNGMFDVSQELNAGYAFTKAQIAELEFLRKENAAHATRIRSLEDSLHRIVRECKASSTQTTRIKRIEARADAALNGRDVSFLSVKDKRVDQVAYINQLSLQNRLKEETIAEQAAQIEMLRGVLTNMQRAGRKQGWQQSYESEMDACAEALAIPTDSKQVLSDWLDSVLGEPIAWSHHCSDNNDQEFYCVDYEPNNGMPVHRGDVPLFKKPEILK